MAIAMIMRWDGITTEQYDEVRTIVKWEEHPAAGGLFHVASHDGTSLHVTDVWESPQHFDAFVNDRLMPGVRSTGVTSNPEVEICQVHAIFNPGIKQVTA